MKSKTATPQRAVAVTKNISRVRIYPQRTSGLTRPVCNAKK